MAHGWLRHTTGKPPSAEKTCEIFVDGWHVLISSKSPISSLSYQPCRIKSAYRLKNLVGPALDSEEYAKLAFNWNRAWNDRIMPLWRWLDSHALQTGVHTAMGRRGVRGTRGLAHRHSGYSREPRRTRLPEVHRRDRLSHAGPFGRFLERLEESRVRVPLWNQPSTRGGHPDHPQPDDRLTTDSDTGSTESGRPTPGRSCRRHGF